MSERPVSAGVYVRVFVALIVLASVSFGLSFVHLGAWSPVVALGIAGLKAVLIAAFFMHLVEQASISRWFFGLGLILAAILFVMISADVLTRERPRFGQPGTAFGSGPSGAGLAGPRTR